MNEAKANLLYNEIDRNPLFRGTAVKEDRSTMNATFVLNDESHTEAFDKLWKSGWDFRTNRTSLRWRLSRFDVQRFTIRKCSGFS